MTLDQIYLACVVAALLFGLLSLWIGRGTRTGPAPVSSTSTRFLLILLRLAIGWHLLVEGYDKITSPSWSSETYLRAAQGPLAPTFRELAGDSLRDRLTVGPGDSFPEELDRDWQTYVDHFENHYGLTNAQRSKVDTNVAQQKKDLITKLKTKTNTIKESHPNGVEVTVDLTIPQRLKRAKELEESLHELEDSDRTNFGDNQSWQKNWKRTKSDLSAVRSTLKADLKSFNDEFKESLRVVLDDEQKNAKPPSPVRRPYTAWTMRDWAEAVVMYGLFISGACLIIGLFTPLACIVAFLLLLSFYLAMPPLPWLIDNPRAEGHYIIINKNIIEMIGLLVLASTQSGRWCGLDGLIRFPFRKKTGPAKAGNDAAGSGTISSAT